MRSLKRTLLVSWIIMAALAGALLGPSAIGYGQQDRLPKVVTIDLGRSLDQLDQRADNRRRIKSLTDQRDTMAQEWRTRLQALDSEFAQARETGADEDDVLRRRDELVHHALRYEQWLAYANERIDHEASLLMRDLYRAVKEELKAMSAANGYDIVIRDDSIEEIPVDRTSKVPQELQVVQAITSVQVLHSNRTTDITEALVTRMNNAWSAGSRATQPAPTLAVDGLFDLPPTP